jgi:hypothetical protein
MRMNWLAIAVCGAWLVGTFPAWAQEPGEAVPGVAPSDTADGEVPAEESPAAKAADPLLTKQQQVAERFRELERLMLRMAELTAPSDPRRAALLRQAVAQSKERAIDQQFDTLVELLKMDRLSSVVKGQGEVQGDLIKLLELLLSEDRSKRIESEKERVREYLKRVNQIIKEQKSVQNATQRDAEAPELADRQESLSDKTGKLADDLREDKAPGKPANEGEPHEESGDDQERRSGDADPKDAVEKKDAEKEGSEKEPAEKDGEPADGEKSEGEKKPESESAEGAKSEGEKSEGEKSDGESKPGEPSEGKKSDESKPGAPPVEPPDPGQPQQGQPQEGHPQEGQQSPAAEQNPAQQRLEKAQQRMQEAQKKLEEAKREDAVDKQEEALRELEQAKAELEEILRQLREEEMSRTLAMLEARFRKMLDAQVQVYEGTQRLDKVPEVDRDRDDAIEAGRLSRKEAEIAMEADKALIVLQEEGSAVAFPEAVIEIRDDMLTVRDRLAEAKIGEMTQGIEQDIITALEEMITALEKAQKDMQEQQQKSPPGQGGGENETPLVDTISELKMIRALQMRVNTRTQRYAELTKTEQVDQPELIEALRALADREQRIFKVTRDIVLGRNR